MNFPRKSFTACYENGIIYVVGGISSDGVMKKCEGYQVYNDKWINLADLNIPNH